VDLPRLLDNFPAGLQRASLADRMLVLRQASREIKPGCREMKTSKNKNSRLKLTVITNQAMVDQEKSNSNVLRFNHYFAVIDGNSAKRTWHENLPAQLGAA
jgi:hypothetical protein